MMFFVMAVKVSLKYTFESCCSLHIDYLDYLSTYIWETSANQHASQFSVSSHVQFVQAFLTDFRSDISAAPKVVAWPRSFEAAHKSNVTFHCNATGIPDPVISWSKEGSDIPVRHSAGVLSLTGVISDDNGRYICTAKNAAGTSTTSIELTVEGLLELRLEEKKDTFFSSRSPFYVHFPL